MSPQAFDPNAPAGVFTSRWWGIVSTVYLVLAPLPIVAGVILLFAAALGEGNGLRPVLFEPPVFQLVCLLGPMVVGFLVATGIEFRRKVEPPLPRRRFVLRMVHIVVGFTIPFLLAYLFFGSAFST